MKQIDLNITKQEYKIKTFFRNKFYFVFSFFEKLNRLIKWIPIIWKTRDFDYRYAIDVFMFQLKNTSEFLSRENAMSTTAKFYSKRIKRITNLMEKVYDEDYACEYHDKIQSLYGEKEFKFIPIEDGRDLYRLEHVFVDKNYSDKKLKEIEKHETKLFFESREKQEKAHKLLWKLIEHDIRNWWD